MTVEEFLVKKDVFIKPEISNFNLNISRDGYILIQNNIKQAMIEFAKYHCKSQLEAILNDVKTKNDWEGNTGSEYYDIIVDMDSIINAYNLNNIK
jgi:2-polyprenyl-3-methyl-5-hydroxy-6-metoxy-1,4-benzoquinol methylase